MLTGWGGWLEVRKADKNVNNLFHETVMTEIGEVRHGIQRIEDKIDRLHLYKEDVAAVPYYPILVREAPVLDPNELYRDYPARNDKALY
jgi:hypothetical protein